MTRHGLHPLVRTGLASALTVPLVLTLAAGAGAAGEDRLSVDDLPSVSDSDVAAHRVGIDVPDITAIDVPKIKTFAPEVSSDGTDTVVSLDTDVLFHFGEARLTGPAGKAVVRAVREVPQGAEVAVVGHTDSIGSDEENQTLSEDRAEAVARAITKERPDLDLTVSGKGETQPVAANTKGGEDNPDGRAKNRRVEIRYAG